MFFNKEEENGADLYPGHFDLINLILSLQFRSLIPCFYVVYSCLKSCTCSSWSF